MIIHSDCKFAADWLIKLRQVPRLSGRGPPGTGQRRWQSPAEMGHLTSRCFRARSAMLFGGFGRRCPGISERRLRESRYLHDICSRRARQENRGLRLYMANHAETSTKLRCRFRLVFPRHHVQQAIKTMASVVHSAQFITIHTCKVILGKKPHLTRANSAPSLPTMRLPILTAVLCRSSASDYHVLRILSKNTIYRYATTDSHLL